MSEDRSRRSHRPSPSPSASAANNSKPKNAAEAQKALLDKLFVDPTKEIVLPKGPQVKTVAPPRDMIPNVQGSSAGAGSGEFHVYKQSRRREYERLKAMETEDAKDKADAAYRAKQEAMKEADDLKTAKNRAKRLKKKEKRSNNKGKGKAGTAGTGNNADKGGKDGEDGEGASSSDDSGSEDGHARQKKRKLANGAPGTIVFRGKDERPEDDDQPREEEVKADRIDQAVNGGGESQPAVVEYQGIKIVDED